MEKLEMHKIIRFNFMIESSINKCLKIYLFIIYYQKVYITNTQFYNSNI